MANLLSVCRYCGESIYWLSDNGKNIPVDAETVTASDTTYEPSSGHVKHWCEKPREERNPFL